MRRAAAALALLVAACSNPPYPRGSLEKLYPAPPRPTLHDLAVQGRTLRYAFAPGTAGATPLVFVHGSPGDWQAWARYLDDPALAGYGARIAFDRPGFGGSGAGQMMPALREQAALLSAAVATLRPERPPLLVGHSLGGPLIAWMLLDAPARFCGAVSIAGSLSARREAPRWYNRLADTALARWLLPAELIWSNAEILPLQAELRALEASLPRLTRPLVAVQGQRDELVEPATVDDLAARVPPAWLTVRREPDAGHFVLWEQRERITGAIRSLPCGG